MKSGYYTDKQGNVLGYWELNEKPVDTDQYTWVESDEKPALYVPPKTKEQQIRELQYLLDSEDWIVARQMEQNTLSTEAWEAFKAKRQYTRDQINSLQQE